MFQILTVGSHKFSTDNRYSVKLDHINSDFQLLIRGVRSTDLGNYECQVNTNPLKVRVVRLEVRPTTPAPQTSESGLKSDDLEDIPLGGSSTSIVDAPDIYFKQGSLGERHK